MTTREFDTEFLRDELDVVFNNVSSEFVEERRWYNLYDVVFEFEGSHWLVEVASPATEMQEDIDPFLDSKTVGAVEVELVTVSVQQWKPKV